MQLLNRPDFLKHAQANRIRAVSLEPNRGGIFDQQGRPLVKNRPSYNVFALPWIIRKNPQTLQMLSSILEKDTTELKKRISRYGWFSFQPTVIQRDISFSQMAKIEIQKKNLPGIDIGFEAKRSYPLPEAVHLLGYVGERKREESARDKDRIGLTGKHGIELVYEEYFGGEPGIEYKQVDVSGKSLGVDKELKSQLPKDGWDLHLNIDGDLQKFSYELMKDKIGAVILMDPRNGAVLTLLSLPDYDPTVFAGVLLQKTWDNLISDPGHPLLNRAVQGMYPPGSTYKMVILTAALDQEIVTKNTRFNCPGGLQIGRRFFKCWKVGGHGSVDAVTSIRESCDVYFYSVGMTLGAQKMADYARKFGFGMPTGIDFNVEQSGVLPDKRYLDKKYGKKGWTRGQSANISIGQGDVLLTPVQLAVFTSAIAKGFICKPQIASHLSNPKSNEIRKIEPEIHLLDVDPDILKLIRQGMYEVVNVEHGTAYWLRRPNLKIAGKTGTSQNPHGLDHALFVGYAPFDDPQIVAVVVVEHGEHGSTSAAPIACKLMERFMDNLYPGPKEPVKKVKYTEKSQSDSLANN